MFIKSCLKPWVAACAALLITGVASAADRRPDHPGGDLDPNDLPPVYSIPVNPGYYYTRPVYANDTATTAVSTAEQKSTTSTQKSSQKSTTESQKSTQKSTTATQKSSQKSTSASQKSTQKSTASTQKSTQKSTS